MVEGGFTFFVEVNVASRLGTGVVVLLLCALVGHTYNFT
jgi:hypothetical protein